MFRAFHPESLRSSYLLISSLITCAIGSQPASPASIELRQLTVIEGCTLRLPWRYDEGLGEAGSVRVTRSGTVPVLTRATHPGTATPGEPSVSDPRYQPLGNCGVTIHTARPGDEGLYEVEVTFPDSHVVYKNAAYVTVTAIEDLHLVPTVLCTRSDVCSVNTTDNGVGSGVRQGFKVTTDFPMTLYMGKERRALGECPGVGVAVSYTNLDLVDGVPYSCCRAEYDEACSCFVDMYQPGSYIIHVHLYNHPMYEDPHVGDTSLTVASLGESPVEPGPSGSSVIEQSFAAGGAILIILLVILIIALGVRWFAAGKPPEYQRKHSKVEEDKPSNGVSSHKSHDWSRDTGFPSLDTSQNSYFRIPPPQPLASSSRRASTDKPASRHYDSTPFVPKSIENLLFVDEEDDYL